MSKLTTFLILLNMVPLTVFFQLIVVPSLLPHLLNTPASWLFSFVFSLFWNGIFLIGMKVRDRNITKEAGY